MIEKVRFRNFKVLADVSLHLERLTVLVGPNASGKTSVLQGLHHIRGALDLSPREWFVGESHVSVLRTRSRTGPLELAAEGTWNGARGSVLIQVQPAEPPQKNIHQPDKNLQATTVLAWDGVEVKGDQDEEFSAHPAYEAFGSQVLLRLDAATLAEPSYSDQPLPEYSDQPLPEQPGACGGRVDPPHAPPHAPRLKAAGKALRGRPLLFSSRALARRPSRRPGRPR